MHCVVLMCEESTGVTGPLEQQRREPTLAAAVVCAVREADAQGRRVVGVLDRRREQREQVVLAADLILRLRRVAKELSEEELALLLELLPL